MNTDDFICIRKITCIILLLILVLAGLSVQSAENQKKTSLQSINIEITTHLGDQQIFLESDVISFLLTLDKDAYITVVYQDASNKLYQVIPNRSQSDNYYKKGLFISVPPQNAAYRFKVQPPFGKETLWVFASDKSGAEFQGKYFSNDLMHLKHSVSDIREIIKTQSDVLYGESNLVLHTRKK